MNDDIYHLINKIFCVDTPLSKEQHLELHRSPNALIPEVNFWLKILESVYNDWLAYSENPVYENKKLVRDIFYWGFRTQSFNLDQISDAVYIAYRIEPEIFKAQFKTWLRKTAPLPKPKFSTFLLTEPFEYSNIQNEFLLTDYGTHKSSEDS